MPEAGARQAVSDSLSESPVSAGARRETASRLLVTCLYHKTDGEPRPVRLHQTYHQESACLISILHRHRRVREPGPCQAAPDKLSRPAVSRLPHIDLSSFSLSLSLSLCLSIIVPSSLSLSLALALALSRSLCSRSRSRPPPSRPLSLSLSFSSSLSLALRSGWRYKARSRSSRST